MADTKKKFYLTTPIYYVNARPHIGHAYTTIASDVIARRQRLLLGSDNVWFLTGTDEHGQKVQRSAQAAGITPQQFTDEVSAQFRSLWQRMGITYNDYIRTTEPRHVQGVQKLFAELYSRGHIYLDTYTGQYSVGEEMFVEGPPGTIGPDGKPTETVTEENFYFRLSAFQAQLIDLIEADEDDPHAFRIEPESRRNEVLSFLRGNVPSTATTSAPPEGVIPNGAPERTRGESNGAESRNGVPGEPARLGDKNPRISPEAAGSPGAPSMTQLHRGMGGNEGPGAPSMTQPHRGMGGNEGPGAPSMTQPHHGMGGNEQSSSATERIAYSTKGTPYVPGALKNLSISRSSFDWGIPVPEPAASTSQKKHVIYVWFDALTNYMTAVGYGAEDPAQQAQYEKFWPADLHLVGKEIIRMHCVYWPAFLLGLNSRWQADPGGDSKKGKLVLDPDPTKLLPNKVQAHGWLLFEESKMSKSRGNIVRTETILDAFGGLKNSGGSTGLQPGETPTAEKGASAPASNDASKHEQDLFGSDVLRYFLLREIPFGQDGSFSFDALVQRYNSDLANGYGNLVSRTLTLIVKSSGGIVEDCLEANSLVFYMQERKETHNHPANDELLSASEGQLLGIRLLETIEAVQRKLEQNAFADALTAIGSAIASVDQFISSRKPWAATETELSQQGRRSTLYTAAEAIRIITALLYPILPYSTAKVWQQLGLGDIEAAAKSGDLNNLQWGGLKPGTKLGPLGPIFPRAPKELIQTMTDSEQTPTPPVVSKLVDEKTTHTAPAPEDPTHPGAAPRTSELPHENPGAQVGASSAPVPDLAKPPAPHTEAPASGIFSTDAAATTQQIAIDDFVKIELRVAKILVAERIPKADKLLRLEVDLGYEKRQILSGIAQWYAPEDLIGRRIIIVANLAPRKMRGLESHGMLLAASHGEDGKPILATFAEGEEIELGSRLK